MKKSEALSIAIKCMEQTRKAFSQPKMTMFKDRTEEEQKILDDGIKEIDEAVKVVKSVYATNQTKTAQRR